MGNEIVDWKTEMENQARAAASMEQPDLTTISLKGGIMTYADAPLPDNELPCVIVGAVFENKFYGSRYNPLKAAIPDCYALSLDGESMAPHADATNKQNEACEGCPNAEWGTADGGNGRGKACKETRKLLVIPASEVSSGNIAKASQAIIGLPVTSVKAWSTYVNRIAAEYKRPPWAVFTKIFLVPDAKTQFKVNFECMGIVGSDEALGQLSAASKKASAILLAPYTVLEEQPAPQAPSKSGKKY
jgi:hypothetical protein